VLAERFGMLTTSATTDQVDSPTPIKPPRFTLYTDNVSYAWLDIIQNVDKTDPVTRVSADIVARVLGGGRHSEMYQHLRMNRRLSYDVRASNHSSLANTSINCFCSIAGRTVDEALEWMTSLLDGIVEHGLTAEQFESEKVRLRRWHELSLENPLGLVSYLAYAALRPDAEATLRPNAYINTLNTLSLSTLNESAANLLSRSNRYIFLAGRFSIFSRIGMRRRLRAATAL
jgi:predicted Zn-dependent peptidase